MSVLEEIRAAHARVRAAGRALDEAWKEGSEARVAQARAEFSAALAARTAVAREHRLVLWSRRETVR